MVTLVSDIIRDAYRESNLISIGTEPSGAQRQEAIRFINRLIPSVLGHEGGESLSPVYVSSGDDLDNGDNVRLIFDHSAPLTITLPDVYQDGVRFAFIDPKGLLSAYPVTILGGKNQIEGESSLTLNTAGDSKSYLYRGDIGNWQKLSPVEETDVWPFPIEFDDMFIIYIAFRLNPRYNIASQSESLLTLKRSEGQFRSRYKQAREMASDLGLLNLRGSPGYVFNSFERGTV